MQAPQATNNMRVGHAEPGLEGAGLNDSQGGPDFYSLAAAAKERFAQPQASLIPRASEVR